MKRLLFLLLSFTFCMGISAQSEPTYSKTFQYDKRIHDFGTIQEKKGRVSHVFTFTNKGNKPVAITEVNAWCGCTTTNFTKSAIMPGKTGKVTVTYNPFSRPGKFSKEVVVLLNDGKEYTRIWVKGNVIGYLHPVTEDHPYYFGDGLYLGYEVLPFASLEVGASYTFDQRIANNTNKPMTVVFKRVPDNRVLKMPDKIQLKPMERTTFKVTYRTPKVYHHNRYILVYPIVNGKKERPIRVTFFGVKGQKMTL
jgi:hypothetical protein